MKEKKIKLINDDPQNIVEEVNKETEEKAERENTVGRPSLLTPEMWNKLLRLFERHFFIDIVAAKADIYKYRIYDWRREQENFRIAVTHAQDKWIARQMRKMDKYAKDKREKDWRELKYKLSIARIEYNDKKYLREAPGTRETPQITIVINQRDLETSKIEASKVIGDNRTKTETIPLLLFGGKKKAKKDKKSRLDKIEDAKSE